MPADARAPRSAGIVVLATLAVIAALYFGRDLPRADRARHPVHRRCSVRSSAGSSGPACPRPIGRDGGAGRVRRAAGGAACWPWPIPVRELGRAGAADLRRRRAAPPGAAAAAADHHRGGQKVERAADAPPGRGRRPHARGARANRRAGPSPCRRSPCACSGRRRRCWSALVEVVLLTLPAAGLGRRVSDQAGARCCRSGGRSARPCGSPARPRPWSRTTCW